MLVKKINLETKNIQERKNCATVFHALHVSVSSRPDKLLCEIALLHLPWNPAASKRVPFFLFRR